jgi:hypothetical protein
VSTEVANRPIDNGALKKKPEALPLAEIEAAIKRVRHGVVQIIIQDGVVVQIDRTEKQRLR